MKDLRMTDDEFIQAARSQLDQFSLPILYLHLDDNDPPDMVLVDAKHWGKIMELIPESEEATDLCIQHWHLVLGEKND